jgi:hypothetical protein
MQLQMIKAIIAAAWVLAATGILVGPEHLTLIDRLTLAVLAIVPPVAMWFWWTEPMRENSDTPGSQLDGRRTRSRQRLHW